MKPIQRRAFLEGMGTVLALPALEAMVPRTARAQPSAPRRFLAYYVPNGMHMPAWTPAAQGADYALSPILQPLAPVKDEILVLSGLANLSGQWRGVGDLPLADRIDENPSLLTLRVGRASAHVSIHRFVR